MLNKEEKINYKEKYLMYKKQCEEQAKYILELKNDNKLLETEIEDLKNLEIAKLKASIDEKNEIICVLEQENADYKWQKRTLNDILTGTNYDAKGIINLLIKYKEAIEILKDFFDFDIYAGEGKGYIDCCVENPTFDLYNDTQFKEYELLKEVLCNDK